MVLLVIKQMVTLVINITLDSDNDWKYCNDGDDAC